MLNQKKVEIFLAKFHKSLAKQFLEIAFNYIWYSYVGNFMFCSLYYGDAEI